MSEIAMTMNPTKASSSAALQSAALADAPAGGSSVPWMTVLPMAAVLAYADGFWLISERGAVGAIERTQEPFASWLLESTFLLPLFVFAVLGAVTVALRCFGPVLRSARTVPASALMIVVAGTMAGIAALVASSAYDYVLETEQLQFMNAMHGICAGDCLAQAEQSTLSAQLKAVLIVSGFILVTNFVLVGWMLALRGGRLALTSTRGVPVGAINAGATTAGAGSAGASRASSQTRNRAQDLRLLLIASIVSSAVIHAAVIPDHLADWPAAGVFFILLTAVELGVAGLLLARPQRAVLVAAVVISAGPLLLWLYTRMIGLPFGPSAGAPESLGLPDIVCCAVEIITLVAAMGLLRRADDRLEQRPAVSEHVRWLALIALVAATVIGLAGTSLISLGGSDDQSHITMSH